MAEEKAADVDGEESDEGACAKCARKVKFEPMRWWILIEIKNPEPVDALVDSAGQDTCVCVLLISRRSQLAGWLAGWPADGRCAGAFARCRGWHAQAEAAAEHLGRAWGLVGPAFQLLWLVG